MEGKRGASADMDELRPRAKKQEKKDIRSTSLYASFVEKRGIEAGNVGCRRMNGSSWTLCLRL